MGGVNTTVSENEGNLVLGECGAGRGGVGRSGTALTGGSACRREDAERAGARRARAGRVQHGVPQLLQLQRASHQALPAQAAGARVSAAASRRGRVGRAWAATDEPCVAGWPRRCTSRTTSTRGRGTACWTAACCSTSPSGPRPRSVHLHPSYVTVYTTLSKLVLFLFRMYVCSKNYDYRSHVTLHSYIRPAR